MNTKKKDSPKSTQPAAPAKKRAFKQSLQKPQPWRFGGRGPRDQQGGSARTRADAERLAGKSRKVH